LGAIFRLGEVRCNGIRSRRPVDSQNGEALGFAKPNLVALPASRRTFGVAARRT
jgi:hypothetical protein